MQADHAHRIILSLGLAILCLAASESATAQFILKPSTARHFHANSFVSGSAEIGARFGYSLAVGDFNDDGFDDLAIGVPYQPYQGDTNNLAGAVIVAYGAWDGLGDDDALPVPGIILYGGIAGPPQHLARFGWALAVGDFDNDGYDDLAVGAPGYDISGNAEGAVYTFHGGSVGLSTVADIRWSEAVLVGVLNDSEQFGSSLAAGDVNFDARDDLAIGIPWDMISGVAQGSVAVLYANAGGLATGGNQLWHQDSPGMPGTGESGDRFGWSLSIGSVNGGGDLLIGIPGESQGSLAEVGAVSYLMDTPSGLATSFQGESSILITQDWLGDPEEVSEAGDNFGSTVLARTIQLYFGSSGDDDGFHNQQGLLQVIQANYPQPNPTPRSMNRYGGPGGELGSGGIAQGNLYWDGGNGFLYRGVVGGEPGVANGRGAVLIALQQYPGDVETAGATYFSNAFGLTPQEDAHFGKSVAVGNFNGRGADEIVIGTPLWDHCIPFNPPLCLADRGQITVVDDTVFANGFD